MIIRLSDLNLRSTLEAIAASAAAAASAASSAAGAVVAQLAEYVTDAQDARAGAESARDGAVAIAGPVDAVVEGLVKNTGGVGPLTSAALFATIDVSILDKVGSKTATSSTGFLRLAGTTPGSVPVVKPASDGRAGVWELTHNDTTGYIFHLLAGAGMGHNAALIACGVDNDGIGLLIPNKKKGRAIVLDQQAGITESDAYGFHATQRSSVAPLMRLEMQADNSAPVLQLLSFGAPTGGQYLLYVGDPTGEAGKIRADNGEILWNRNIRVYNKPTGETEQFFIASTSSASNSSNTKRSYHGAGADYFFAATGAAGVYYPYKLEHAASSFSIQTAANLTAASASAPAPAEVGAWTSQISVSHATGVSLRSGKFKADATGIAFHGAAITAQPTAVADAAGGATIDAEARTQLNALLSRLRTIGLIAS